MESVLVTGAAGLIGSAVIKELHSRKIKVVALDNFEIGDWKEPLEHVEWIEADVTSKSLTEKLDPKKISGIIHCAAHPGGKSLKEPSKDVDVNATGSMKLFEWCALNKKRVTYLSSSAIYGPKQPQVALKEDAEVFPGTIYGVCKQACENFLRILGDGYELDWRVVRPFATYGAGHKPSPFQGIINILLTQMLRGNDVLVKGPLERVRGIIYVDDAARGIVDTHISEKTKHQVLNISHPEQVTINDMIKIISESLGKSYDDLNITVDDGTVGDPMYNYADCSKSIDLINFTPQNNHREGISKLVQSRLNQK